MAEVWHFEMTPAELAKKLGYGGDVTAVTMLSNGTYAFTVVVGEED